jgi:hypothetical protein
MVDKLEELLRALQLELRTPPRPDAVCKLETCLSLSTHILPSKNIHLSDPDYRGFFRVFCRDHCIMDYHRPCWHALKEQYIATLKFTKLPTERDFFGKSCFTPNCGGIIYKIEIHEQDGSVNSLLDRAAEEERERKKELKQRREPSESSSSNKNKNKTDVKKLKKFKAGGKNTMEEDNAGEEEHATENKENERRVEQPEPVDYSCVDLSNATVIKKNRGGAAEEEEEEHRKKKRGANRKSVLSLEEFNGNQGIEVPISICRLIFLFLEVG